MKENQFNYSQAAEPTPITEHTYPENTTPWVSISCIAYNHEAFIRDAIEGFLMQKTTFPVEILVHDDASTDNTANIIKEYERHYPSLFNCFYQPENTYHKPNKRALRKPFKDARKGKYIALCEGDDYWINPLKLQRQVDFLEANPGTSLVSHPVLQINMKTGQKKILNPIAKTRKGGLDIRDVILGDGGLIKLNSMVYRRDLIDHKPGWMQLAPAGDYALALLLATRGNLGFINEPMGVYRKMTASSWSVSMRDPETRRKHYIASQLSLDGFDDWTNQQYSKYVKIKKWKNRFDYYKSWSISLAKNIVGNKP